MQILNLQRSKTMLIKTLLLKTQRKKQTTFTHTHTSVCVYERASIFKASTSKNLHT
jgi:hypothetical protein